MRVPDLTIPANLADQELRQLELALRPSAMAGPLAAALHRAGLAPANDRACHILDVKYAPGERCAILYELGERLAQGTFFDTYRGRDLETGRPVAIKMISQVTVTISRRARSIIRASEDQPG